MSKDDRQYRQGRLKALKAEAMSSKTRSECAARLSKLTSIVVDYSDVEAVMGTWWMQELLPDGGDRGTEVREPTLSRMERSMLQTWCSRKVAEISAQQVVSAVSSLRAALRDAGVMTSASQSAAKFLLASHLGATVKDHHPSSEWKDAEKEVRKAMSWTDTRNVPGMSPGTKLNGPATRARRAGPEGD